jgi:DUF1009 family protein
MKIGIIAGSGQFPILFSKAAREKGLGVYAAAFINEADPKIEEFVNAIEWMHVGQLGRLIRFFKQNGVVGAVMIGAIKKTRMFSDIKPDAKAILMLAKMKHTHDDNVLRRFARLLEDEGIHIKASTFLLPEILAPEGCWTQKKPKRGQREDIELGWRLAKELGRFDIGQCMVVGGGTVLAVEAIDGTDATILRGGKLGQGNAVVVKVSKPNQDMRFDVPTVGARTIQIMKEANAGILVVEAGKTIAFDRERMIAEAEAAGIVIVGRT